MDAQKIFGCHLGKAGGWLYFEESVLADFVQRITISGCSRNG